MKYEVFEDRKCPGDWRVEGLDPDDGTMDVAIFSGPRAEILALEYFQLKTQGHLAMPLLQSSN